MFDNRVAAGVADDAFVMWAYENVAQLPDIAGKV